MSYLSRLLSRSDSTSTGTASTDSGSVDGTAATGSQNGTLSASDLLSAFQQLTSQLQGLLIEGQGAETGSSSAEDRGPPPGPPPGGPGGRGGPGGPGARIAGGTSDSAESSDRLGDLFSSLDTDGDGTVSQAEFLAARPDGVTEEQATGLWSQLDSEASGSLTQDQFTSAMSNRQGPPPGPPPGGAGFASAEQGFASGSTDRLSDLFGSLDTDGDGTVSQAEFLAGRPDGVTEEQATGRWSQLDSEASGSLTQDQFTSAMASRHGPPPGPPPGEFAGQGDSGATAASPEASSGAASNGRDLAQALLAAIESYTATLANGGRSALLGSAAANAVSAII